MPSIKKSRLRLARMRLGYEQKQIAKLLGYKTIPQISRYETGQRLPSLKIALKFSIIYKLPVRVLFNTYYEECLRELESRAKLPNHRSNSHPDLAEPSDYCSYTEMMNSRFLTDLDKKKVKKHILNLMVGRRTNILDH